MSNRRIRVDFEHFLQIKGFCKTAIGTVGNYRDRLALTFDRLESKVWLFAVWTSLTGCARAINCQYRSGEQTNWCSCSVGLENKSKSLIALHCTLLVPAVQWDLTGKTRIPK